MRVLLDEDLPHALRRSLAGHVVMTVGYAGYSSLKNGELIAAAERDGFEVLVTGDRNVEHQQNMAGRRLALVVLSAQEWPIIREHLGAIESAVDKATPGTVRQVECGRFRRG